MIYILLSSMLHAQAKSTQNLVYDLSLNGSVVGERRVDITYVPSSRSNPLGMRRIELWTTLTTTVQGEKIAYTQRGTAQSSDKKASFVISTKINEQVTELQGKRSKKGNWLVHQISMSGLKKTEFRRSELSAISLELFDPRKSEIWSLEEPYQILIVEGLEPFVLQGVWSGKGSTALPPDVKALAAKQLQGKSSKGILNLVWSDDGMLIDWDIAIMGLELNADLRSVPHPPNFGDIVSPKKLGGIEEQEL